MTSDLGNANILPLTLSYWGKTLPSLSDTSRAAPDWKPVAHHLIDVAAAAIVVQRASPTRLRRDAEMLGCCVEQLVAVSAFLCGLHDLGKFSKSFQQQSPRHWPEEALGPLAEAPRTPHWRLTLALLAEPLAQDLAVATPDLLSSERIAIAAALAGHHGAPPDSSPDQDAGLSADKCRRYVGQPAIDAAQDAMKSLWRLLGQPKIAGGPSKHWVERFGWRLAGLTTLSDWIGSDATYFSFEDPTLDADAYWPLACAAAERAVAEKGLAAAEAAEFGGVRRLFPMIVEPRPMQAEAQSAALPDGPMLAILEDATGAGKTEAALTLAHRLIVEGRAEGIFFALPTMATANAMFERLKADEEDTPPYRRIYAAGARPSLALAHGRAQLSRSFAEVGLAARPGSRLQGEDVAAECAEWIADSRRKAFFAEIGAGTIDQALIAVLPKKYLALRQYGLAGKVLIVDEAHSYDAYMRRELETLLQFHAAAGGSAIVLSATLTAAARRGLVNAFQSKPAASRRADLTGEAYPQMTLAGPAFALDAPVAAAAHSIRRVAVERIGRFEDAVSAARDAAAKGAAVAWIRNAVDDATEAYQALLKEGVDATLFHARFAMCDRLAIEAAAVGDFGKTGARRAGRVLVATQVVEASLDLDFDVMISDLAPTDLIIQRAGRLWRHQRKARPCAKPLLKILAPDWERVQSEDWLAETQPRGRHVYRPGVLWRSAKALFEAGAIDAPAGLRALVEAASADAPLPEPIIRADARREGEEKAARAQAGMNLIDWASGYVGVQGVGADQEVGTRLGAETWTLRLARLEGDDVVPWAPIEDGDRRCAWALSEVSLRKLKGEALVSPHPTPPDWSRYEQDCVLAVVAEDGALVLGETAATSLRYERDVGLVRSSPQARG